ncbi:LysR substrate-binding domain-containing protein [Billgrantia desiderata]|uniref:LysR substrate-binding domain-containing protein n=1 Tax=Billgrantia desiderata TaxID=52021 RepID=UPI00089EF62A|nr:LysR substrate-binding domain-containing protein [Halomonas desiderata]SEG19588.1 DNA-binding transcriptional regulator, LysR family [Halomonas desiderata]
MARRLPPMNTLRLFEAAARHGQLKVAAEELSLTPSAVSHGVRTLEQWLGIALFQRTPQGLRLTAEGERYASLVRESLTLLSEGTERMLGAQAPRRLAISVPPFFAVRWLLPRLGEFRTLYPDITVLLDTSQQQVSLEKGDADLAIRMGRGDWPALVSDLLFRERLVPVCAPTLVEQLRVSPMAVCHIHLRTVNEEWQRWCEATGHPLPAPERALFVDTLQLAYEAASSGFGVAMGRRPLVDTELEQGRLVQPWQDSVAVETGYWLAVPPRRQHEPVIALFRDWLLQQKPTAQQQ